jgi:hypothetical protein
MSLPDPLTLIADTQLAAWQIAAMAVLGARKIGATVPEAQRMARVVVRLQPGATLALGHHSSESFEEALQMLSHD